MELGVLIKQGNIKESYHYEGMASYRTSADLQGPSKISLEITDLTNSVKYKKKLYSWTNISELKKYIEKKSGVPVHKQKLLHKNVEVASKYITLENLGNISLFETLS